jgi:hypothetical protein
MSGCDSVLVTDFENLPPEEFLRLWEEAVKPTVDGRPILRYALVDPRRLPIGRTDVHGVPDDVLAAWYEEDRHEEETLEDLAARHGGGVETVESNPARVVMVRDEDGAYRVIELDADGQPTGFESRNESLEWALRESALVYGSPMGTLAWTELLGNAVD